MSAYPPEKAGQAGAHTLPNRSTGATDDSRDYLSDEEAVSDTKPSDVLYPGPLAPAIRD